MTNNKLTDGSLTTFSDEQLKGLSAGVLEVLNESRKTKYEEVASKVIIKLVAELQERCKADPLIEEDRKELARLRHEDGLRRQQWAQQMQHDPTFGGILPKF